METGEVILHNCDKHEGKFSLAKPTSSLVVAFQHLICLSDTPFGCHWFLVVTFKMNVHVVYQKQSNVSKQS